MEHDGGASAAVGRMEAWRGESVADLARRWGVPSVEAHDRIGSTNDRCAELARGGAPPFTTVLANAQSAGRGRRGTRWLSEPNAGLLMSVVLPPPRADGATLPLLVGLAVAEAIERTADLRTLLKWPNDVLIGERKVAGVLCERTPAAVVAGIGVNLAAPRPAWPPALRGVAVSVEEALGSAPDPAVVCGAVLDALRCRIATAEGADLAALPPGAREALAARDALRGRRIESEAEGPGVGAGIDADGALLLASDDGGLRRVVAGSVTLVS